MRKGRTKMRKIFELEDLDCANCAAKMAEGIRKIEGVSYADINFLTQRLTIEAEDGTFDEILKKAAKVCKKIEPDCLIKF